MTPGAMLCRRRFLAGVGAVALAPGAAPRLALAGPSGSLDDFLALSRAVTGHDRLDGVLAEAILAAFGSSGAGPDIAAIAPEVDGPARRALLKAWYLGRVAGGAAAGPDAPPTVVGYEATLMGRVVADIIPLRSYCGGRPHFWTDPPAVHTDPRETP